MTKEDEEREWFIGLSGGVNRDGAGQYWRYSSYGSGEFPGLHPAMLRPGQDARPRTFTRDAVVAASVVGIVVTLAALAALTGEAFLTVWGWIGSAGIGVLVVAAVVRMRVRGGRLRSRVSSDPSGKSPHRHR